VDAYRLLHPGPPEIAFEEHPNVRRHELRSRLGWLSPLLTQQTGRPLLKRQRLSSLIRSRRYDVVHFHNVSLLGPKVFELASDLPAVRLCTAHEHWFICPMHVLWKRNERPCEKPECLSCTVAGGRPPQLWRYTGLIQNATRHVDQFLSPSRFSAGMHAERGFPRPMEPFPYFVERRDRDWKEPAPRPQGRPYFLFVGRLEYIKGVQTLIEAWKHILDIDLLIAGTGTYEARLRELASSNPRIKFLGPLPQRKLGNLYCHALAGLVPSVTYETFGIICIEAFARKTPVIARDLGALSEVIEDSGGGFTYRTEEELIAAIRRIGSSPRLRTELGESGYRSFLRWWTEEAHLERYFQLLNRCAIARFGYVPWEADEVLRAAAAPAGLPIPVE
jgi:glycosyltransferase involved in cell wall biosynthesis